MKLDASRCNQSYGKFSKAKRGRAEEGWGVERGRRKGAGLFPAKYSICEANFVTYREFSLFIPLTKSNLSLRSCVTGRKINSLLPPLHHVPPR